MKINLEEMIMALLFMMLVTPLALAAESDGTQTGTQKGHQVSNHHIVMYINEPHLHELQILVKRKHPYHNGWTLQEQRRAFAENQEIVNFIRTLKGNITVYTNDKKKNIIDISLPLQTGMDSGLSADYFSSNGNEWQGTSFGRTKIGVGDYIITSELYSGSNEYNEVMIGLVGVYGDK